MNNIIEKIDPGYIQCTTGICEHNNHQYHILLWVVVGIAFVNILALYSNVMERK